jgi:hypothetical protein
MPSEDPLDNASSSSLELSQMPGHFSRTPSAALPSPIALPDAEPGAPAADDLIADVEEQEVVLPEPELEQPELAYPALQVRRAVFSRVWHGVGALGGDKRFTLLLRGLLAVAQVSLHIVNRAI